MTKNSLPNLTDFFNQQDENFSRLPINYFLFTTRSSEEEDLFNDIKNTQVINEDDKQRTFCLSFYKRISKVY